MPQVQMDLDSFLQHSKVPALPAVAIKLMEMMTRDTISFSTLAKLLMTDASLSVQVLRAANSPLFGTRTEVTSIPHALATLGLDRVGMLVATTALWRSIPGSINRQLVHAWWRHNLATALLAQHFAGSDTNVEDCVYMAGLLHSIGQLSLLGGYPAAYHAALTRAANGEMSLREAEREAFGMDHCEVGFALLSRWHVPEVVAEAARHHHHPEAARYQSTRTVAVACQAASFLGYASFPRRRCDIEDLPEAVRKDISDAALRVMVEERVNALEASLR